MPLRVFSSVYTYMFVVKCYKGLERIMNRSWPEKSLSVCLSDRDVASAATTQDSSAVRITARWLAGPLLYYYTDVYTNINNIFERGSSWSWLSSYLCRREQSVRVGSCLSNSSIVECTTGVGVRTYFVPYVNDYY